MTMTPEYFQHDMDEQRELVEKYAAAARVISLHLREFCDESLPYDEMIAEAARGVAEELAANRACNLFTWKERAQKAEAERNQLRSALVALVGVDGREDLEQMEAVMRLMPAPAQDKAATIDAIHALIATLALAKADGR